MPNSDVTNLIHELIQWDHFVNHALESKGDPITKPPAGTDGYKVNQQDPDNGRCLEEVVVVTGPPKVVSQNLPYIGECSTGDQQAALVCMQCIPMSEEIIRKHAIQIVTREVLYVRDYHA